MEKARRTSSPSWAAAIALVSLFAVAGVAAAGAPAPRRILVDTDMDTDDLFALLYILKQDRSQFDVKVIWCRVLLRLALALHAMCRGTRNRLPVIDLRSSVLVIFENF